MELARKAGRVLKWAPLGVVFSDTVATLAWLPAPQDRANKGGSAGSIVIMTRIHRDGVLRRGDAVVLYSPTSPRDSLLQRVVGLEGDVVRQRIDDTDGLVPIPRGGVWVEATKIGAAQSALDSNSFGAVSSALVRGRARVVIDTSGVTWVPLNSSDAT